MANEPQEKKKNIGAIWTKTSPSSGVEYLSISVEVNGEKLNFSAFKNQYFEPGGNKPEWNIAPPRDSQTAAAQTPAPKQVSKAVTTSPQARQPQQGGFARPAPKPVPRRETPPQDMGDEDVPF